MRLEKENETAKLGNIPIKLTIGFEYLLLMKSTKIEETFNFLFILQH